MSEATEGSSGAPTSTPAGSEGNQSTAPAGSSNSKTPLEVSRDKALAEKRNVLERNKELESELQKLKEAELEREGDLKKSVEFYKTKAEEEKAAQKEAADRYEGLKGELVNAQKLSAIRSALPGKMRSESYWDLVDSSKVVLDPDGNIDQESVTRYAGEFASKHPELLDTGRSSKSPNEFPPGSSASGITEAQWDKLPHKEQVLYEWDIPANAFVKKW